MINNTHRAETTKFSEESYLQHDQILEMKMGAKIFTVAMSQNINRESGTS